MAALPAEIQVKDPVLSRAERADDIARLKHELRLSRLEYTDISARLELERAQRRWPFLQEFGFADADGVQAAEPLLGAVRQGAFGAAK